MPASGALFTNPPPLLTIHHDHTTHLLPHPCLPLPAHCHPRLSTFLRPTWPTSALHAVHTTTINYTSHPPLAALNHTMNPSSSSFSKPVLTLKQTSLHTNSHALYTIHNPYLNQILLPTTRYKLSSTPPLVTRTPAVGSFLPHRALSLLFLKHY